MGEVLEVEGVIFGRGGCLRNAGKCFSKVLSLDRIVGTLVMVLCDMRRFICAGKRCELRTYILRIGEFSDPLSMPSESFSQAGVSTI